MELGVEVPRPQQLGAPIGDSTGRDWRALGCPRLCQDARVTDEMHAVCSKPDRPRHEHSSPTVDIV
jgi:hypothetical protein